MPTLIIATDDGVVIKEVPLTKERTTLGRRPYNDVVMDNLAVSGEHAVLHLHGGVVEIEDLHSTNGTFVNGQPVQRQTLRHGDTVGVGRYQIRFTHKASAPPPAQPLNACIQILTGAAAGREMELTKIVTTIGKPGVAVASITHRPHGFVLAHVEGSQPPTINGTDMGEKPASLQSGDVLELADTRMRFVLR
ncbi:MAG: FHA domain-containing protein [Acidovorax sp.]